MYHYTKIGLPWSAIYTRKEEETLDIGIMQVKVIFKFGTKAVPIYLSDKNLNKYYPKKINLDENNVEEVLNYFYTSEEFSVFFRLFKKAFIDLAKEYNGFPSTLEKTEVFIIEFTERGTMWCQHPKNNFHTITIACNVERLWFSSKTNSVILKHELYHVISSFHEGQEVQTARLIEWELKLRKKVTQNREKVDAWISEFERDFGTEYNIRNAANLDYFWGNVKESWGREIKIYWNMIIDTALNVIAMELEDINYIEEMLNCDYYHSSNERIFKQLQNGIAVILSNNVIGTGKKKFYVQLFILLEFIEAYSSMPFNILPYAIMDEYWREHRSLLGRFKKKDENNGINYGKIAKEHIAIFENQVNDYLEPEAASAFFEFWEYFKVIVKSMRVRVNPRKPDIKRQIHNAESLHTSKEGYKLLNRIFYRLFKKVKELE